MKPRLAVFSSVHPQFVMTHKLCIILVSFVWLQIEVDSKIRSSIIVERPL